MNPCKGLKGTALKKCQMQQAALKRQKAKKALVVKRTKARDSVAASRTAKRRKAGTPTRSTSLVSKKKKS